jgi:hypothetical protein
MQIPFSLFLEVITTQKSVQYRLKQIEMIVLKINKRFGSSRNKVSSDIDSNTANKFIKYLEACAMLRRKFSGGDKAKYALYIEIIVFSIRLLMTKALMYGAVMAKRSIEILFELNSELKVSLGVIIQGL